MSRKKNVAQLHELQRKPKREVTLVELTRDCALDNWDKIAPYLKMAFKYSAGRMNINAVYELVNNELGIVMAVYDIDTKECLAIMVAESVFYPNKKVFSIGLCGGKDVFQWGHSAWEGLQEVALKYGHNQIEVCGRRGWGRFLKGAEETSTLYAMDLEGGSADG